MSLQTGDVGHKNICTNKMALSSSDGDRNVAGFCVNSSVEDETRSRSHSPLSFCLWNKQLHCTDFRKEDKQSRKCNCLHCMKRTV